MAGWMPNSPASTILHELTHKRFGGHLEGFENYLEGLKNQYYLLISAE